MSRDLYRQVFFKRWKHIRRQWHRFSRNSLSILGLIFICSIAFVAVFAPYVSPYPRHAGRYVNFPEASQPPSLNHPFGTDLFGRDMLSRVFFGFRFSLLMGVVVLAMVVPVGVILGLIAGYFHGSWIDTLIMRTTDVFLAVPPLILALAICSVFTPNLLNAMVAVSLMWWPWYARLTYGIASSKRGEFFIQAAEAIGASKLHILFREILPNCISPIFTKMTLDMGFVILIGASLSFVGLGAQAPTPDLGSMIADGSRYLPDQWWISVFPAFAIVFVVLGFNLLGDGLRDVFAVEGV